MYTLLYQQAQQQEVRSIPSLTCTHSTLGKYFYGFCGRFTNHTKGHDYLFVVVDRFNTMCILMPCKKTIKGHEATNLFFEHNWVHFGIPRSIISDRDTRLLSAFWTTSWEKMDTKLKSCTTFHPQKNGQTKVVNMTLVEILRGYSQNHLKTWNENMIYIQHSFNRAVHAYIGKSPFETCFGYFPPSPLDVVYG
jgi:hypothetical protein